MKQVSMMYEISVFERKYINSEDSSVEVSFQHTRSRVGTNYYSHLSEKVWKIS